MTFYTVKQVAAIAGISIRTLHHYDDIGLLKPAKVGANGYRYYGRDELLRLQQILIYREMDVPLVEIGSILDEPGFNLLSALEQQRQRVEEQAKRYTEMLRTIDRTIAEVKGDRVMKNADLYSGIVDPVKQAEYEAWLEATYGPCIRDDIEASKPVSGRLSGADAKEWLVELQRIEEALARQMKAGVAADDPELAPLLERHRAWVARMWNKPCSPEAYAGLVNVYQHPDFQARYETIAPGFADYLISAMKAWITRRE